MATTQQLIFRKGLDMKEAVAGDLAAAYDSALVDEVRANDYRFTSGRLTIHLAREFGFCYGVDRAVDYAYQARRRFPGRNVFLTGEIIHNPHVNDRLRAQGIRFLSDPGETRDALGPDDVVILPAFGVTVAEMAQLTDQGCTLVDTTCGSVLNVWKNVIRFAKEGFTSIIHNPHVNDRLRAQGIRFLSDPGETRDALGSEDVVILPAFGVTVAEMAQLTDQGCTLVDTTCGSVLNVWKNVIRFAKEGFTSIIHGKVKHEETRATASQALKFPNGHYLVVLDRDEAGIVCDYIRRGGDRDAFLARFGSAVSPGFDPDRDLVRIGCANQTTMLMSESLGIGEMFREAMAARYGSDALAQHFRAFDTICSATQERQDAVVALLRDQPLDLMLVVGGYNSSNTCNLARICAEMVRTYHIADPDCLLSRDELRHRPVGAPSTTAGREESTTGWLPPSGTLHVGLTAGASTPNNIVGQVIQKLSAFCG